jgi:hypothetical protein
MFTVKLTKQNGKLIHIDEKSKLLYKLFLDKLPEGQKVEMFIDIVGDVKTGPQLAKVHACIRELSKESGYNFEEMKKLIKQQSGLCYYVEGEEFCKSFTDCSKDELALAIETCVSIGRDNYNMNLT